MAHTPTLLLLGGGFTRPAVCARRECSADSIHTHCDLRPARVVRVTLMQALMQIMAVHVIRSTTRAQESQRDTAPMAW
jgi:hypothetical protein